MAEMTPRQRVLTALRREELDRVPFLEPVIEEPVVLALMGLPPREGVTVGQFGEPEARVLIGELYDSPFYDPLDVARMLHLDGFGMYLFLRHEGLQREIGGRQMVAGQEHRF